MVHKVHIKEGKKKTNWALWITVALVFLMVSSTLGFISLQTQGTQLTYNGYDFVQTNQGYSTSIDDTQMTFQYFPDTIDHIEVPQSLLNTILNSKVVTVTYNPQDNNTESLALIQYNLFKTLEIKDIYIIRALTNNTGYNLPQVSCDNATFQNPVIHLKTGNQTEFTKENNCLIVSGYNRVEFAQIHDRLLYGLLEVIQ